MSGEHTPGPWHVGTHRPQMVYDNDGFMVADLSLFLGPDAPAPSEERIANARLTAAAPELLAAAKAVQAVLNSLRWGQPYPGRHHAEEDALAEAIAKAEGGAQCR